MQTFLPYADFARSAAVLDRRRLGERRIDALQILRALMRPDYRRRHHPVVRMWRGHADALLCYAVTMTALLRKDRAHDRRFSRGVPDDLPYAWPASSR